MNLSKILISYRLIVGVRSACRVQAAQPARFRPQAAAHRPPAPLPRREGGAAAPLALRCLRRLPRLGRLARLTDRRARRHRAVPAAPHRGAGAQAGGEPPAAGECAARGGRCRRQRPEPPPAAG